MLKKIVKKLLFSYKSNSEEYLEYMRKIGVKIGKNCVIFCPKDTSIDLNNPHLLEIGDDVKITGPVTILTHDYSTCVINSLDKKMYGKQRKTTIGNNVFIGWGATILSGTTIGDNVIIGAGSVVSGKIDSNSVYAGNPVKKIMSIDKYREKIMNNQLKEAFEIYKAYTNNYNEKPKKDVFHEYFFIFEKEYENLTDKLKNKLTEEKISKKEFELNNPLFSSYYEFMDYCDRRMKDEEN